MLCPQCGKSVGDRPELCESCKQDRAEVISSDAPGAESAVARGEGQLHFVDYAGFWLRVWAYIFDGAILLILSTVLSFLTIVPIQKVLVPLASSLSTNASFKMMILIGVLVSVIAALIVQILLSILYFPLFESSPLNATPGKLFFNLLVVNREAKPLSKKNAFLRAIAKGLPIVPMLIGVMLSVIAKTSSGDSQMIGLFALLGVGGTLVLSLLQYPMAAFTSEKQALHDLIAKTYVVRRSYLSMPETVARAVGTIIFAAVIQHYLKPNSRQTVTLSQAQQESLTIPMQASKNNLSK